MNPLDMIILIIMGFCMVYGVWKGLVRDLFSIVAVVVGFVVASRFYPLGARLMGLWLNDHSLAKALGFLLIFLLGALAVAFCGWLVRGLFGLLSLGWLDRMGGGIFGLLKGLFICAGLVMVLVAFLPPRNTLLQGSRFSPYVVSLTKRITALVPRSLDSLFRKKYKELVEAWMKNGGEEVKER